MAANCTEAEPTVCLEAPARLRAASVCVVVPTYNESGNLRELHSRIRELPDRYDLLIVDDCSPDGTGQVADQIAILDTQVHVVHRPAKMGYASALRQGMTWALAKGADVVVTMDADLSHDPGSLPSLVEALETADVAVGSRYVWGGQTINWPWAREVLSRIGNLFIRAMLGRAASDWTGGFRAYRASAVIRAELLAAESVGYAFGMEALHRCVVAGLTVTEVPITFSDRRAGRSKLSSAIVRESLRRAVQLRTTRRRLRRQLLDAAGSAHTPLSDATGRKAHLG